MNLRDRIKQNYEQREKGGKKYNLLNFKTIVSPIFYTPIVGANKINILPWKVETDNCPDGVGGLLPKGETHYVLDAFVHRFVGPGEHNILCLKKTFGKPCPICEEQEVLRTQKVEKALIDKLTPTHRVVYNVQDLQGDSPRKVMFFEASYSLFEKEMLDESIAIANAKGDEVTDFVSPENGYSVRFRGKADSFAGKKFLEFKSFGFDERKPISDQELADVVPLDSLLNIPTYEKAKALFFGLEEEEVEEDVKQAGKADDAEIAKYEKPARRERKPKNECPYGHKYGHDCDAKPECESCPVWDACMDKQDELRA